MGHLLAEPHHDGSPLHLDDEAPALGSRVGVRVRTHTDNLPDAIWVRTVEDAEPFFAPLAEESREGETVWWRGEVHVRNPVTSYRFMLVYGDSYSWLNQSGVHDRDVSDAGDFVVSIHPPAPDWARDAVVYQVFPDRFARSASADDRPVPAWAKPAQWGDDPIHVGPDTPLQFYGGDLDGIREHLDHMGAVGADTLYLTPVFPGESNHRYNASTFDHVDDLLGGDDAYRRLIDAVHERGWRMLGDFTANHTGDTHEWFRAAAGGQEPERGFYYFDADGAHEGWKGYETLPKLDHRSAELTARMQRVVRHWLEFGLDGWRIDVANMTGRHVTEDEAHRVARDIRATSTAVHPDAFVVGEHNHDAAGDLDGDGWHGTMNYSGFSFPVWSWLRDPDHPVPSFGLPTGVARRTGPQAIGALREFQGRFGWRAVEQSWNILGSHDSPRIRTLTGSPARHEVAVAMQFTLPGIPMVFAGDELGLEGTDGEDSRRTMPWDDLPAGLTETYRHYADLRRAHVALRRGSLRWVHVGDDLLVYLREHPDGDVMVTLSRGGSPALELPDPYPDVPAYDEPTATVVRV